MIESEGLLDETASANHIAVLQFRWDRQAIARNAVSFKAIREGIRSVLDSGNEFSVEELKALEIRGMAENRVSLSELVAISVVFRHRDEGAAQLTSSE